MVEKSTDKKLEMAYINTQFHFPLIYGKILRIAFIQKIICKFTELISNTMEESKRQRQIANVIQQEMSDIFQREGLNIIHNGMISISKVKVTPDLMEVRIYLSFFQISDADKMLKHIQAQDWNLRKQLAARIKNQVRKIPVIQYYLDDTLEYVSKMDELFKTIEIPKE